MNKDITPERWSSIKALFAAAVEVPASERSELLVREAQGDSALIAEVQSLLAAHDQEHPDQDRRRHPEHRPPSLARRGG